MSQIHLPTKIRYEYEQDDDAKPNYTHGVWGGINPQGEVELNFYVESDKVPAFSERSVNADGSFGPEMAPYNEDVRTVVRNIHSKILVNYHTARALLEWLEEKIETLDAEDAGTTLSLDTIDNREQ